MQIKWTSQWPPYINAETSVHTQTERERAECREVFQSLYLERTPIRPRAENWFELGGIGGIPELRSEEIGLLVSSPKSKGNPPVFGASFTL